MKKITLLILMLLAFDLGFGQMNDLIISEYGEGSVGTGNSKYIEIYNGTGSDINLSDYRVWRVSNGGVWPEEEINLSGTLATGDTFVLANGGADPDILAEANLTNGKVNWSGDDAVGLAKDNGSGTHILIDAIGTDGPDPGAGWNVAGTPNGTRNYTLVRKPTVCSTNTNWTTSAGTNIIDSEWIVLGEDIYTDLGSHATDCCIYSTTWTAGAWSNGNPSKNTIVTIDDNYNTGNGGLEVSFRACTLIINSNVTLTIADNTYIEVENDLTVDVNGSIIVNPQGSFVQNNDLGNVVNNGSIQVEKITAPMDAWYEYTYWSSPVSGETISSAITDYHPDRTFKYSGDKFLDATAETNNDNSATPGHDDIDDNGDDWTYISGATVMQPGVGYATPITPFAYNIAPGISNKTFKSTFSGSFNNGVYTVPVYRNDSEGGDNNWNLIGNPYPSAIDAGLFFAANTEVEETQTFPARLIVGAVYLWSQNTPPSSIANGNQGLNFSDSDFAIINGLAAIAGGDGIDPEDTGRKIPSGQAFFVSYSDAATPVSTNDNGDGHTISQGNVTFNNGMRTTGVNDNSQFFKGSNTKNSNTSKTNKLWVNLTSDNGVFNQIALAYVDNATDSDDGSFYDAQKNSAVVTGAILYSNIEGSNKKFAIQGKASTSLNTDETISLGYKSNIGVATLFKLSIDHLQGDFLSTNTIYLKDNLLNKLHDLSASDYTFTTEVGEFNERFEIAFTADALSTSEAELNTNKFSIINLGNNNVEFNTNSNLSIKTVALFDLLGRQVYNLPGNTNSETYNLPKLTNSVYIAKIELSNGLIVTKKAIKK